MCIDGILNIPADLGADKAKVLHAVLCTAVSDRAAERLRVEFDGPEPTAVAAQLAIACQLSLRNAGRFGGYGPFATVELPHADAAVWEDNPT